MMLGEIARGSLAVLRQPYVETFEEHERGHLGTALVYLAIAAVINAILNVVSFELHAEERALDVQTLREIMRQSSVPPEMNPLADSLAPPSVLGSIASGLLVTIVIFLVYVAIIYGVGRLFGGTGSFAELAWDTAMFYVPLAVLIQAVELLATGALVCGVLIAVVLMVLYLLFLTYQSIRAGMNLSPQAALGAITLIMVLGLALSCTVMFSIGYLADPLGAEARLRPALGRLARAG